MKAEGGWRGAREGWPGSQGGPAVRVRAGRGCHFGVGKLRRRPGPARGDTEEPVRWGRSGHVSLRGGVKRTEAGGEGSTASSHGD